MCSRTFASAVAPAATSPEINPRTVTALDVMVIGILRTKRAGVETRTSSARGYRALARRRPSTLISRPEARRRVPAAHPLGELQWQDDISGTRVSRARAAAQPAHQRRANRLGIGAVRRTRFRRRRIVVGHGGGADRRDQLGQHLDDHGYA